MLYAIVAVIMIICDQFVKYLVESRIVLDAIGKDVVRLIPGFIHATNVHNYGAAFSFLEGARWFFIILCIVFVLLVIYVLAKDIINTPLARWFAVIVLAGAVGNCIDRIVCGYVVDMLEFEFLIFGRPFPVFNIADIFITVGAIAFCICTLLEKPALVAEKPAAEAEAEDKTEEKPKKAAKPLLKMPARRSHKKTEIPNFPKREPVAPPPAIDPNDPFAEWEKRANAPAPAVEETPSAHVSYTQPAAAAQPAAPAVEVSRPAAPAAESKPVEAPAAPVAPAAPASAPKVPVEAAPEAETFSLDDILAEFKDL